MHPYNIVNLHSVSSTNDWAKKAYAAGNLLPNTVIVAETQTAGRGQLRTLWHDEPGKNLLATILIEPKNLKVVDFFALNEAVTLALVQVLERYISVKIKWPNDIICGTQKLAGVLIETAISGDKIKLAYLGIGLNVNQQIFPKELHATSLAQETHEHFDIANLLFDLLSELHRQLGVSNLENLHANYLQHVYGLGQKLYFKRNGVRFRAKVETILPNGTLILRLEGSGKLVPYQFKEVDWILTNE